MRWVGPVSVNRSSGPGLTVSCGTQSGAHLRRLQHDALENFHSGQPWQIHWKVNSAIVFPLRSYRHATAKAAAELLCYGYSNWHDARHG